jgi:hypothetical protein
MFSIKPVEKVIAEQDAVGHNMLAVVGALDEPPQFAPGIADGPLERLRIALAIDPPTQAVAAGSSFVDAAVTIGSLGHHNSLLVISAEASVIASCSGVSPRQICCRQMVGR